jgi:hypothetical protein
MQSPALAPGFLFAMRGEIVREAVVPATSSDRKFSFQ